MVEKEYQELTDGALILKATKNHIAKELAGRTKGSDAQDYFDQAETYCISGKYTETIEALEKSLTNHPTMSAFLNLGNVLFIT